MAEQVGMHGCRLADLPVARCAGRQHPTFAHSDAALTIRQARTRSIARRRPSAPCWRENSRAPPAARLAGAAARPPGQPTAADAARWPRPADGDSTFTVTAPEPFD